MMIKIIYLSCIQFIAYARAIIIFLSNYSPHIDTCCVLLSGGVSSRMSQHKALLAFSETKNFLEQIVSVYKNFGVEKIIVVANKELTTQQKLEGESWSVIQNNFPEKGRLYSFQLAIEAMIGFQYCFVQNIDNPFIHTELLNNLWKNRTLADYVSPVYENKGGHPIILHHRIMQQLKKETNFNQSLKEFLQGFSRMKVAMNDNVCLVNINTPEDFEFYFSTQKKKDA